MTGVGLIITLCLGLVLLGSVPRNGLADDRQKALTSRNFLDILSRAKPVPVLSETGQKASDVQTLSTEPGGIVGYDLMTGEEAVSPASEMGLRDQELREVPPQPGLLPGHEAGHTPIILPLDLEHGGENAATTAAIVPTRPEPLLDTYRQPWNTIFKLLLRFNVNGI
ncbi:MAG: hypothetical protein OEU26_35385, partial [Candidatus Tectomicrobia bacterium]|nr:hypothetical protein [Candidatus Tectomicrobia bacterium]